MSAGSEANILKLNSDVLKHAISFIDNKTISILSRVNKDFYLIIKQYVLDTVHHVAWIEEDGFHIKYISSMEKEEMDKDLWSMMAYNKQYLLEDFKSKTFDWAMFVKKQHRGVELNDTKGYWKMLKKDYHIIDDLNTVKSLVLHKEIAPMLLNYDIINNEERNQFRDTIIVNIHDSKSNVINKYDVLFWNGASPNQCNTFEIHDHQKQRKRYFINFDSSLSNIYWHWYETLFCFFKF